MKKISVLIEFILLGSGKETIYVINVILEEINAIKNINRNKLFVYVGGILQF